jgi:hypothetical protein
MFGIIGFLLRAIGSVFGFLFRLVGLHQDVAVVQPPPAVMFLQAQMPEQAPARALPTELRPFA